MSDSAGKPLGTGTCVALSGGGHRASLFGLGAVMAMADMGVDISSVSSVSGGSLTNGWLAVNQTLETTSEDELRANVKRFVVTLATEGTFQSNRATPTWALLSLLAPFLFALPLPKWMCFAIYAIVLVFISAVWVAPYFTTVIGHVYGLLVVPTLLVPAALPFLVWESKTWRGDLLQMLAVLGVVYVWLWTVFTRRGALGRYTFTKTVFPSNPKLRDIKSPIDHIFCTTEYQTRQAVYFGKNFGVRLPIRPRDARRHQRRHGRERVGGIPVRVSAAQVVEQAVCFQQEALTRRPRPR